MSVNNFNNISRFSATSSPTAAGRSTAAGNSPTARAKSLGNGIDWFLQLDSGKAHPIVPSNQFGKNPPLDKIVDAVMNDLGLVE